VQLKGKQRLLLVGAAILAVILVFTFISSRSSNVQHVALTPSTAAAPVAAVTATAAEFKTIGSWGLVANDFPAGTVALDARSLPLITAARDDPALEKMLAAEGFTGAYEQQWQQTTAQFQFADEIDLYTAPNQAKARLLAKPPIDPSSALQELPDPKLGDASRMYRVTTSPTSGQQQAAEVVEWTRGRALLLVSGASPPGALQGDQILALAKLMDKRAAAAPVR